MKLAYTYDHHNSLVEWKRRDLDEWLTDIFEAPSIKIKPKCTEAIRSHVFSELRKEGWALDVLLDQGSKIDVSAMSGDLAFQLQTGNMSRAPYDLLKLQFLFQSERIEAASLAVPTKECAKKIGSNLANAERISNELEIFSRVITVPILLVAFE